MLNESDIHALPKTKRGPAVQSEHGLKLEQSVSVNCNARDIYFFLIQPENYTRVIYDLILVAEAGPGVWHWVGGSSAGHTLQWVTEIIGNRQNEMIAWQTFDGSDVHCAGSIWLHPVASGESTNVRVALKIDVPRLGLGALTDGHGENSPEFHLSRALRRLKEILEASFGSSGHH
jgi:uncharacterized membrane protein